VVLTPAVNLTVNEVMRSGARARWANEHMSGPGDLFVSIHCNASESHLATGSEVWYCSQSALAADLAFALALDEPRRNRGAKRSNGLSVLTDTRMAAVLLELGFIDREPEWIQKHWFKQMEAVVPVIESWLAL